MFYITKMCGWLHKGMLIYSVLILGALAPPTEAIVVRLRSDTPAPGRPSLLPGNDHLSAVLQGGLHAHREARLDAHPLRRLLRQHLHPHRALQEGPQLARGRGHR